MISIDLSSREIVRQSFSDADCIFIFHYLSKISNPKRVSIWDSIDMVQSISPAGATNLIKQFCAKAVEQEREELAAIGQCTSGLGDK